MSGRSFETGQSLTIYVSLTTETVVPPFLLAPLIIIIMYNLQRNFENILLGFNLYEVNNYLALKN